MKITKLRLKQIIKEELQNFVNEQDPDVNKFGNIKMKIYMHAMAVLNGQQMPKDNLIPALKETKNMGPEMAMVGKQVFNIVRDNLKNINRNPVAIEEADQKLKQILGF